MKKIFIDCGAHCGESILRAKKQFGEDIEVISFEPIPYFAKEITKIHENDNTVSIHNCAVWIENGEKTFNLSPDTTDGSSLLEYHDQKKSIKVKTIDLSSWIKSNFNPSDYIILKLDIEGAEYAILNKLIEDDVVSMINEFWGEWHENRILDQETKNFSLNVYEYFEKNNIIFNNWDEHILNYGKADEKTAYRPFSLEDVINKDNSLIELKKEKLWLTGLTSEGNSDQLKELIDPIKNDFDGLIWTFHYPKDEGSEYLESVKGDGEIIYTKWCNRLHFSRNHCLFQGPMRVGDWFVVIDTLEKLSSEFTSSLRNLTKILNNNHIDGVYLWGKRFMFRLNEHSEFVGNPHEGIKGSQKPIELTQTEFWKDSYFENLRPKLRESLHWVNAFMKYYLFPQSNHLVLHFEHDAGFINQRYEIRYKFFNEIHSLGYDPLNIKSVIKCINEIGLTNTLKECINSEKILNDWYRYEFLGARDQIDKHDFSLIIKI